MLITFRALKVSYSDVGKEGIAVNCEKTQLLLNTLYLGAKVNNQRYYLGAKVIIERI